MDSVIRAVDRIRAIPGADVDRNFGQGRQAVRDQIEMQWTDLKRRGELREIPTDYDAQCDELITVAQEERAKLHNLVAPHHLPDDYVFFLEYYGGLFIGIDDYSLLVDGIGPMTEQWYGFIMGDNVPYKDGLLNIGSLSYDDEYVILFLDLAGVVQQNCVIGVKCGEEEEPDFLPVIRNLPHCWTKLADSFTAWLERIAETGGTLGYTT